MFERVYLQDDAYHNELIQSADIVEQTSSIMTDEDDEDDYFDEEEEQRYLRQVQEQEKSSDTLPSPDYLRADSQNQRQNSISDLKKKSQNEIKFDKKNWKYKNQYKTIKEENSTLMSQSYRKEPSIIIDTLEDEQQNEMEGITERKSHRSTKIEQTRLKPKLQSIYIQGDNTYNQKKENSLKKKYLKIYNNYANLLNFNQKTYQQASQAQKQAFKFVAQQKTSEKNSNTNSNNLDFQDDISNMSPNQQPNRTKRTKTGSITLNDDAASFKNIRPKKISSGNNLLHPNNFQQSLSKLEANKGKNMMNMSKYRNINALQNIQENNNNNPILAQIQNLVKQNMERRQSLQRVSFLNALNMANSKQYTPTSMVPYEGSLGYQVNKDLEKINKHKEEKYRGFWPLEIDAMKQYKIYFTQNNCEIILEQRLRKQLKWIESSRARKNFYKTQFISKYGTIYTENYNQNIKQSQKLY
ncbi:hypothetical protein PPERSA_08194 [Pseudocohnilembus persalinus]|uniref:Uncharacterized protein n=1 Tax=Pseudocohnilembus persalinus TaxID=266149 RepID=A0A0V0R3C4_PSEPJ|nr:hypothetical protein PPERSA_08194 [Pseudocohnilembus persalinus]|eukprot:KRX08991.1 hypothetical protein PPERSA_08194 [Pseudocohnilembus persalinus]